MRKIELINKQEQKESGKSFDQIQEIFKDAQCELVTGKQVQPIESYTRALTFAAKTDTGNDSAWTTIEGPNNAFLCVALDKADCMARIQGQTHTQPHGQEQSQRASA